MQMKTTLSLALALMLAAGAGTAFAQDTTKAGKPLTAQQQKMKTCNAEAKTKALTGADRKTFMKTCLGGSTDAAPAATVAAAPQTQQEKMKTCSTEAKSKSLKGAERKTFMSDCLKGSPSAAAH